MYTNSCFGYRLLLLDHPEDPAADAKNTGKCHKKRFNRSMVNLPLHDDAHIAHFPGDELGQLSGNKLSVDSGHGEK